ncbi:MAG: hypothetical protein WA865_15765 [Spirulinaceae cyanobacterium]
MKRIIAVVLLSILSLPLSFQLGAIESDSAMPTASFAHANITEVQSSHFNLEGATILAERGSGRFDTGPFQG